MLSPSELPSQGGESIFNDQTVTAMWLSRYSVTKGKGMGISGMRKRDGQKSSNTSHSNYTVLLVIVCFIMLFKFFHLFTSYPFPNNARQS